MRARRPRHGTVYQGKPKYRAREVQRLGVQETRRWLTPAQRAGIRMGLAEKYSGAKFNREHKKNLVTRFYRNNDGKVFVLAVAMEPESVRLWKARSSALKAKVGMTAVGLGSVHAVTAQGTLGSAVASVRLQADERRVGGSDAKIIGAFRQWHIGAFRAPRLPWRGHFFTKMFVDAKDIVAKRLGLRELEVFAAESSLAKHYARAGYRMRALTPKEVKTQLPAHWIGTQLAPSARPARKPRRRRKWQ